jgi:poly(3-hydroxybutyrate) depolymerase
MPGMKRRRALLFFVLLCSAAGLSGAQAFDLANAASPTRNLSAELDLPVGAAPLGAVVVLHGCNGDTRRC